ncbi:MAG: glycoside hydrolase family 3 protein [Propionibacteriaceae bacterium]|nr:glycoside hydrolase family 3 protein [Propionibacteriaceae bacterium]
MARAARRARPLIGACLWLALAGCAIGPAPLAPSATLPSPSGTPVAPTVTATPTATGSAPTPTLPVNPCLDEAAGLSLRAQVGQLVMVGVGGGLDAAERRAIKANLVGSVVLLGAQDGGVRATRALTRELAGLNPEAALLVAADQEGGLVQRLRGSGFSRIPSAARQAKLADAELRAAARGWGAALGKAGVLLDLAPVADVVPAARKLSNAPIGRLDRGYGSNPAKVTAKTGAVIGGLADAGVAAAVKHFPGLGEVTGNTDHTAGVVDRVTTARSASLQPFRAAAEGGVAAVMVSSATYSRIDGSRQAVFSPKVIGLLRGWGYDGVVISDDLGAAVSLRRVAASDRAVRFLAAGGDLVINADPALTGAMVRGVLRKAKASPDFAEHVTGSAARVLLLKSRLGTYDCG